MWCLVFWGFMNGLKFVERIETILSKKGKSRADMSRELGIPYQSFSDWKRRRIPSADICLRIGKYLGVPVEYLITGNEPDEQDESRFDDELEKISSDNYYGTIEYDFEAGRIVNMQWSKTLRGDDLQSQIKENRCRNVRVVVKR